MDRQIKISCESDTLEVVETGNGEKTTLELLPPINDDNLVVLRIEHDHPYRHLSESASITMTTEHFLDWLEQARKLVQVPKP